MAKDGSEKIEKKETDAPAKEREVELVFVSDGVYKYVYSDTKEDVI